ncbi:MAG: hypothetical protein ACFHXK_12430 [bacterium]
MDRSASHPFCIATIVTDKAIEALLEGGGSGHYTDESPWLIAQEMLQSATSLGQVLPILFASKSPGSEAFFSHWSVIRDIDVDELHRGQWLTRCSFSQLEPFNPIFESIDSVFLKTSAEQMDREVREGIRIYRQALDEYHIHPYALCETPAFIAEALSD